jgi:hypothetical protein
MGLTTTRETLTLWSGPQTAEFRAAQSDRDRREDKAMADDYETYIAERYQGEVYGEAGKTQPGSPRARNWVRGSARPPGST